MGKVFEALASLVELVLMAFLFPLVILLLGLPVALLVRVVLEIAPETPTPMINWRVMHFNVADWA